MSHDVHFSQVLENKYTLFLDEEEYKFIQEPNTTGYGSWAGTNASLAPEKTFRFRNEYNTLKISPLVAATPPATMTELSITHEPKYVPNTFANDSMVFYAFFYSMATSEVSIFLSNSNGASVQTDYVEVPAQTWTLVRSAELAIPYQTIPLTFTTTIDIRNSGGTQHIHMAHPVLINSYGFTQNLFLRETLPYTPRFLLEVDSEQSNPKFPMGRMLELGLAYGDRGFRQSQSFKYNDISEGYDSTDNSTKSKLVDATAADIQYLPWLAQFVGVPLRTTVGGTTPWSALPANWEGMHTDIDLAPDVAYSITTIGTSGATVSSTPTGIVVGDTITVSGTTNFNGQFSVTSIAGNQLVLDPAISEPDEYAGTVTLVDTSWIEIESFNLDDSNVDDLQRSLLTTARTGHNAGTKQAIVGVLNQILLNTKYYSYSIQPTIAPWVITLKTLTSETPGGETGESSELILSELAPVKPMGFTISHECIDIDLLFEEPLLEYNSGAPYDGYSS